MQEFLIQLFVHHSYAVYGFIVITASAEGPILSIIGGILLKMGYFSLFPLYGALMFGDLIGDTVWYSIGFYFGHGFVSRFGKYFNVTEERILKVEEIFHRYKNSILFISKISNGLGFAIVTLLAAGMVKIPFRRYILINLSGQFIWSGLLIAVGYFFSHLYSQLDTLFGRLSLVALFVFLLVLFLGARNYARSKIEESVEHNA